MSGHTMQPNGDPPDGSPEHIQFLQKFYQEAGTRAKFAYCVRCWKKSDFAHRKNNAMACTSICQLCHTEGHKGASCPKIVDYPMVFDLKYFQDHWPEVMTNLGKTTQSSQQPKSKSMQREQTSSRSHHRDNDRRDRTRSRSRSRHRDSRRDRTRSHSRYRNSRRSRDDRSQSRDRYHDRDSRDDYHSRSRIDYRRRGDSREYSRRDARRSASPRDNRKPSTPKQPSKARTANSGEPHPLLVAKLAGQLASHQSNQAQPQRQQPPTQNPPSQDIHGQNQTEPSPTMANIKVEMDDTEIVRAHCTQDQGLLDHLHYLLDEKEAKLSSLQQSFDDQSDYIQTLISQKTEADNKVAALEGELYPLKDANSKLEKEFAELKLSVNITNNPTTLGQAFIRTVPTILATVNPEAIGQSLLENFDQLVEIVRTQSQEHQLPVTQNQADATTAHQLAPLSVSAANHAQPSASGFIFGSR